MTSAKKEYELKFEIAAKDVASLLREKWLRRRIAGRPRVGAMTAVYYDTPEFDLQSGLCALRVRREGRRQVQCFKSRIPGAGGALARYECETSTSGWALRREAIPDDVLPFKREILSRVAPVFKVENRRVSRIVAWDDVTEFELACDSARIVAGERSTTFTEVEIELLCGQPDQLFAFGERIARQIPCRLCVLHKADRGFRLVGGRPPWRLAETSALSAETTAEEAFARLALDGLCHIRQNEQCVLEEGHPEAVHQLRVGVRRLRSLLRIYRPHLPADDWRRFDDDLKWIGKRSGRVRDVDVCLGDFRNVARPAAATFDQLANAAVGERRRAQTALVRALRSPRYACFLLGFLRWFEFRGWRTPCRNDRGDELCRPVRAFATQALTALADACDRKGEGIEQLSAEKRHRVRLAVKQLRYAVDFFGELFPPPVVGRYGKRLKRVQTDLGVLNDLVAGEELLPRLQALAERDGSGQNLDFAVGLLVGWRRRDALGRVKKLGKHWRQLMREDRFWLAG